MHNKKAIIVISVLVLVVVVGGVAFAVTRFLKPPQQSNITVQDEPSTTSASNEKHWDAEQQISEVGSTSTESISDVGDDGKQPGDSDKQGDSSESDPRTSPVVQGKVKYDDIQNASTIEGGYDADDIKTAAIRYLEQKYPTEMIAEIELIGNGSANSQNTGNPTSYVNYLVTLSKGQRIGLSVDSAIDHEPHVTETNYLVVNSSLLYKVAEDEYVPMKITTRE